MTNALSKFIATQLTHFEKGGRRLAAGGFAALLLTTPTHAATTTLAPTADTYVQAGTNATRNYGSATDLRIRTSGTTANNYDSYLKFDTTSVNGSISNAKLRIYAKLSASGTVATTAYAIATTTWGETTLTWNNKPARGASLGSVTVNATSYAWKEIDVTSYVQSEYAANRKVMSFAYHDAANSSPYITAYSKNSTNVNKPQLLITYSTNAAPTVSLTAPANNATYTAPASVDLSANATDRDGTISKVEFYNGTTLLNTDTSAPYSYTWSNVASGSYTLTAKATDNAGAVTTSSPVNISVNPVPNVPPTVSLTAPANNASYTAPASVNLSANATDSDGSITQVAYYNGATLIGQATSAPYSYTWTNVATGSYTLTAKATDNAGAITTSSPVNISVNANQAPSVSLLAPSATDNFTAPATFSIVANAADSDGSVQLVEFYNGATLLGSKTQSPFMYDWLNVAAGSYTLTAKAYDNANASTTSAPVSITVNAPQVAPGIYYIYADHLNTPRVITDSANKTVWRWDSDPFGTDMPYEDPDGDGVKFGYNLRFPGQYYDKETNLHYNYFRDFDPATGRYVQSDPIGLYGGSFSTFAYAGGNPLAYSDSRGLALPAAIALCLADPPCAAAVAAGTYAIGQGISQSINNSQTGSGSSSTTQTTTKAENCPNCKATQTRSQAMAQAYAWAGITPGKGTPIPWSNFNPPGGNDFKKGPLWANFMRQYYPPNYGMSSPTGTVEEHPFGHPGLPGGLNHDCPHFVAVNSAGVPMEFPYKPGSP